MMASALAVVAMAAGCGGSGGSDAAQHSVRAVVRCMHRHGMDAGVDREPPAQPGDVNLFDVRGTVGAHLGQARVTISVVGDGENMADYNPNGTAAPMKLVEAVWACAGHHVTTTPYSCSNGLCTSSH
jgi:hypothetical protein